MRNLIGCRDDEMGFNMNLGYSVRRLAFCLLGLIVVSPAAAQVATSEKGQFDDIPVLGEEPDRPPAEPLGLLNLRLGGFATVYFDDNIYRQENDANSDLVLVLSPGFRLTADLDRYRFELKGQLEAGFFADNTNNDYVDGDLSATAWFDLNYGQRLELRGRYRHDHIPLGGFDDDDNDRSLEYVSYDRLDLSARYDMPIDIHSTFVAVGLSGWDFHNRRAVDGSLVIEDDRDRRRGWIKAGGIYELSPKSRLFGEATLNRIDYDQRIDGTAEVSRDSAGAEALIGWEYGRRGAPIWLRGGLGLLSQKYDASEFSTTTAPALTGDAAWIATDRLLLSAQLRRQLRETTSRGVSGVVRTRLRLGADYQIERQWRLINRVQASHDDYRHHSAARGESRDDITLSFSTELRYEFIRGSYAALHYRYGHRNSTRSNRDYGRNRLGFTLYSRF